MSSSIPSWQILTAHAQPFRGARDLAFCLKVPLDSLLVWASSEGSGETARMRRLAWTFAARIGDKYQIRLARPKWDFCTFWQWRIHTIILKERKKILDDPWWGRGKLNVCCIVYISQKYKKWVKPKWSLVYIHVLHNHVKLLVSLNVVHFDQSVYKCYHLEEGLFFCTR